MPVSQVVDSEPIAPNHVYVIPPNKYLSMNDSLLSLAEPGDARGRRAPIDLFFRTLAEAHGRDAAAIVLSGSGADGTIGAQRLKEHGGVVLAQEPTEAEFDAMPRNAIATGLVDFVLPELRRRGLFRTEYEGKTLRENLGLPKPENLWVKGKRTSRVRSTSW